MSDAPNEATRAGSAQPPPPPAAPVSGRPAAPSTPPSAARNNRTPAAGLVLAIAALATGLVVGALAGAAIFGAADAGAEFAGRIDEDRHQAVILSNDKVYFGKLREGSGGYVVLEEAYFLRESRTEEEAAPVRSVLPVTREIHGPENELLIRVEEIVLVENLADDSPVQREIRRQQRDDE